MGVFDYLKCDAPLPATAVPPPPGVFQTKDTPDQYMETYTITEDGRMLRSRGDGPEEVPLHGEIEFYTGNHPDVGWWEYRARFTDGRLARIDLVEFRAPEGRDRNAEIEAARAATPQSGNG